MENKNMLVLMVKFLAKCGELTTEQAKKAFKELGYDDSLSLKELFELVDLEDTSLLEDLKYYFRKELVVV